MLVIGGLSAMCTKFVGDRSMSPSKEKNRHDSGALVKQKFRRHSKMEENEGTFSLLPSGPCIGELREYQLEKQEQLHSSQSMPAVVAFCFSCTLDN